MGRGYFSFSPMAIFVYGRATMFVTSKQGWRPKTAAPPSHFFLTPSGHHTKLYDSSIDQNNSTSCWTFPTLHPASSHCWFQDKLSVIFLEVAPKTLRFVFVSSLWWFFVIFAETESRLLVYDTNSIGLYGQRLLFTHGYFCSLLNP